MLKSPFGMALINWRQISPEPPLRDLATRTHWFRELTQSLGKVHSRKRISRGPSWRTARHMEQQETIETQVKRCTVGRSPRFKARLETQNQFFKNWHHDGMPRRSTRCDSARSRLRGDVSARAWQGPSASIRQCMPSSVYKIRAREARLLSRSRTSSGS